MYAAIKEPERHETADSLIQRAWYIEKTAALPSTSRGRRAKLQYEARQLRLQAIALKEGN